jgi:hypothetical protein
MLMPLLFFMPWVADAAGAAVHAAVVSIYVCCLSQTCVLRSCQRFMLSMLVLKYCTKHLPAH